MREDLATAEIQRGEMSIFARWFGSVPRVVFLSLDSLYDWYGW